MRRMILTRGVPGCGKSTWIESRGLIPFTISPDLFRKMIYPTTMTLDGHLGLRGSSRFERRLWEMVYDAAEYRMGLGATVVIDATNLSEKEQHRWHELALRHRYELAVVDFRVDEDVLRARNASRGADALEECEMDKFLASAAQARVIDGATVIDPDDTRALEDFLSYDRASFVAPSVSVIGDIQSCSGALRRALADTGPRDAVVLVGDLFDRGPDALGVFEQVRALDPGRTVLVRGNHEQRMLEHVRGIRRGHGQTAVSYEQIRTKYSDRDILHLLDRFVPVCTFGLIGVTAVGVVTHGGVSAGAYVRAMMGQGSGTGLAAVMEDEFVHGTSERGATYAGRSTYDHVDDQLQLSGDGSFVQFHGHRNGGRDSEPLPAESTPHVLNLENRVEDGGALRVARVRPDGGDGFDIRIDEYTEEA